MQDTQIYKYDPKDVICLVGGFPIRLSGPLVIARTNDVTTEQVGQTGKDMCVNINRNTIGTATLPVMAQSAEDTAFSEIAGLGEVYDFYLLEKSTNKLIKTKCWYKTQPDLSLGDEVEYRAHVLTLADASMSLSNGAKSFINEVTKAALG
tara:strand:- start:44499 stop:44948 length:450 start_codon:yes stop_codon:yes gene_type:complete